MSTNESDTDRQPSRTEQDEEDYRYIEPVAAEEFDGDAECMYECESEAEWLVETSNGRGFVCCQPCSNQNRIYARENELYENEVSDGVREAVLEGIGA